MSARDETCATCAEVTGTKRYCARGRCYCGHEDCPAFDTWVDLKSIRAGDVATATTRHRESWEGREGESWIDKL